MAALERNRPIMFGNIPETYQLNKINKPVRALRWRKSLSLISVFIFVLSSVFFSIRLFEYYAAKQEYSAYQEDIATSSLIVLKPTVEPTHVMASVVKSEPNANKPSEKTHAYYGEIVALKSQNSQTIGWLDVSGTNIQYPVVQASDNDYYTNHTFAGRRNASGAIFLDYRSSDTLSDSCIIIYGHNMKDGSMFHELRKYERNSFLRKNNEIVLTGINEQKVFRVFAAFSCSSDEILLGSNSFTKNEKEWMLARIRARTVINKNGVFPDSDDQLIALITCVGDSAKNYWIVYGYHSTNL